MHGLKFGFNIIDEKLESSTQKAEVENYKSATCVENRGKVETQILEELAAGNYVVVNKKPKIVSALGAVYKPNGDVRIIHDYSQPEGSALNEYATIENIRYQSVQDALDCIGPGWYQAKIDLRWAYRVVGINPAHYTLTGFKWRFEGCRTYTYMVDTRLSFGARKSPIIFHRLTQAVRRMMQRRGYKAIVVFLDDFYCAAPTQQECQEVYSTLIFLLRKLGFHINWNKITDPTQRIVFLGVNIDTNTETLWLDPSKAEELKELLTETLKHKRATRKQLESLAGKLNWAANVILWGRLHLRTIYNTIYGLKKRHHKTQLKHLTSDLLWWRACLQLGKNKRRIWDRRPILHMYTDASNLAGGAFFQGDWLYRMWHVDKPGFEAAHINLKELQMIGEAVHHWARQLANHRVVIFTDNISAAFMGNKGTSRHPVAMKTLHLIGYLALKYDFHVELLYIPGKHNNVADAISRLHIRGQIHRFISLLWEMGYAPSGFWLPYHMSINALNVIYPQVQRWQHILKFWMK